MRFFLAKYLPQDVPSQIDPHHAEAGKEEHEGHADLSEELQGHPRVVPHMPAHPLVDDDPGDKFAGGDKDHAPEKLHPQRILPLAHAPLPGAEAHADASQDKHAPVGEAPEHHLKAVVEAPSHEPQQQIFTNFLSVFSHKKRPHCIVSYIV